MTAITCRLCPKCGKAFPVGLNWAEKGIMTYDKHIKECGGAGR